VTKQRLVLLDTEAIAHHFKVAPGTIRRWASQDQWHPYGTRRHRTWSLWEAQASWEHRHSRDQTETCA
jgi:uncharacterized protein YjcR